MAEQDNTGEDPKIIVDDDWKQEAQREKEKIAEEVDSTAAQAAPPASFETLVSTFVTQTLFALGAVQFADGKRPPVNLDLAKHHIDMLGVLEDKTKGNLSEDEKKLLDSALYELRMTYVQLTSRPPAGAAGTPMPDQPIPPTG